MFMDSINVLLKNKELTTLIQKIRIYSQDIGVELSIKKYTMLAMES